MLKMRRRQNEMKLFGAEEGNRTLANCLEGSYTNHYTTSAKEISRLAVNVVHHMVTRTRRG